MYINCRVLYIFRRYNQIPILGFCECIFQIVIYSMSHKTKVYLYLSLEQGCKKISSNMKLGISKSN